MRLCPHSIAVLAAFSLPKLYEMRKDDVDKGVATARSHVTTHYNNVSAQVRGCDDWDMRS